MADDPNRFILEQFRILRSDIAALDVKMDRGFATISSRMDALETEVRGVSYVATVSIGSVLADMNDLKRRVRQLEGA